MRIFFGEDNGTGIPKALALLHPPVTEVLYPGRIHELPKGTSDAECLHYVGAHGYLAFRTAGSWRTSESGRS